MKTRAEIQECVLSVGLDGPDDWNLPGALLIRKVWTGRDALFSLRREVIDLMLVPVSGPDFEVGGLMGKVRALRPKQRWMLVDSDPSPTMEIYARTHGAMKLLESAPSRAMLELLVAGINERDIDKNLARRVRRVELNRNGS